MDSITSAISVNASVNRPGIAFLWRGSQPNSMDSPNRRLFTLPVLFVELNQSFKPDDLYAAVWVTGTLRTKISSKALNYVDGSADIPVGYTLEAKLIEAYQEQ